MCTCVYYLGPYHAFPAADHRPKETRENVVRKLSSDLAEA